MAGVTREWIEGHVDEILATLNVSKRAEADAWMRTT
jgi:hypothetical protein